MKRFWWCFLIVSFASLTGCVRDLPLKEPYTGLTPLSSEFPHGTPASVSMDSLELDKAVRMLYEPDRFVGARSLLVICRGKLVAEVYPSAAEDRFRAANIQSCTKSITGLLASQEILRGMIQADGTIGRQIPGLVVDSSTHTITLEDCLTMRSGLAFDNDKHTLELYQHRWGSAQFVISRSVRYRPGTVMGYNDGDPHLVSAVIGAAEGISLSAVANRDLFRPLGIPDPLWEAAGDGVTYGAFGLYLRPVHFAMVGQLLLQNGLWNGKRIIDSVAIAEAVTSRTFNPQRGTSYGRYFWIYPVEKGYGALGHGGQYLLVFPRQQLVLVYTAAPYTGSDLWDHFLEVAQMILASCS